MLCGSESCINHHFHLVVEFHCAHDKKPGPPALGPAPWPLALATCLQNLYRYCFLMRGPGRVAGKRYCCFCEACCLALQGEGMTPLLEIPNCKRRHLSSFKRGLGGGADHHMHSHRGHRLCQGSRQGVDLDTDNDTRAVCEGT